MLFSMDRTAPGRRKMPGVGRKKYVVQILAAAAKVPIHIVGAVWYNVGTEVCCTGFRSGFLPRRRADKD